jgi:hypothetical protein
MLPSRISKTVEDFVRDRSHYGRWLATAAVFAVVLALNFVGGVETVAGIGVLVAVILVYLNVLEAQADDIESAMNAMSSTDVVPSDADLSETVCETIRQTEPDAVYMVDYSTDNGEAAIHAAVETGADVYVFLRHPGWVEPDADHSRHTYRTEPVNPHQREKVLKQLTRRGHLYDGFDDPSKLHVRLYRTDATARVRKLGDKHVFAGWYTYEKTETEMSIWGHNIPTLSLSRYDEGYTAVDDWLTREYLPMLWADSVSLRECVESEDCPDELRQWLTDPDVSEGVPEEEADAIADRRRAFVEAASGESRPPACASPAE